MNIIVRILKISCLCVIPLFTGCVTRSDLDQIKKEQNSAKIILDQLKSNSDNIPSPILYEIHDISRNKSVGWVGWGTRISTGDRIFLNDDIWDVKMVKVFTAPTGGSQDGTPLFRITYIQVLATFGGKATDPNPKG